MHFHDMGPLRSIALLSKRLPCVRKNEYLIACYLGVCYLEISCLKEMLNSCARKYLSFSDTTRKRQSMETQGERGESGMASLVEPDQE